jgi:hypothetical protein
VKAMALSAFGHYLWLGSLQFLIYNHWLLSSHPQLAFFFFLVKCMPVLDFQRTLLRESSMGRCKPCDTQQNE